MRSRYSILSCGAAVVALAIAAPVQAQERVFDIPAQAAVRAIPELPDTLPAFASAALADEAARQRNWTEAERQYHEAQTILEEYSHTPPVYQQTELMTLNDPEGRRAEIRALYEHVIAERQSALRRLNKPEDAAALDTVKQETLARLDAFLTKEQLMRGVSGTGSGS